MNQGGNQAPLFLGVTFVASLACRVTRISIWGNRQELQIEGESVGAGFPRLITTLWGQMPAARMPALFSICLNLAADLTSPPCSPLPALQTIPLIVPRSIETLPRSLSAHGS